jgi:hypothetical protein
MPRKAKGESEKALGYKPFTDIRFMRVRIEGTDPLIVHAWSEKAVMEILGKQMKVPKGAKEERNPEMDFEHGKYYDHDGCEAFLAVAVKKAMVTAVTSVGELTKVSMRQAFFTWGVHDKERARILDSDGKAAAAQMRADMVRLGGPSNSADIRFRPDYQTWMADVIIEYNALVVSREQIINLLGLAGYGVGIFEWRPERNGTYGRFTVTQVEDLAERPVWKRPTSYLRKGEMNIPAILAALRAKKAVDGKEVVKRGKAKAKVSADAAEAASE